MYTALVIILVVVGVLLLLCEVLLIPGVGAVGLTGLLCLVGGTFGAYYWISPMAGHITLILSLVFAGCCLYAFFKSKMLDKMALTTDIDSKVDLIEEVNVKIGDMGHTLGRLAPMGKIIVNGKEVEAKSTKSFIDEDTDVEIVGIEGNHVIVKSRGN